MKRYWSGIAFCFLFGAFDANAAALDRATCDIQRAERDRLISTGVKSDMASGPNAVAQLDEKRRKAVMAYIKIEETLLFQCARYLPALPRPKSVEVNSAATDLAPKTPSKAQVARRAKKQRQLKTMRARLAAKRMRIVRRVELSNVGSTSKVYQDQMEAEWSKRLASFERGDPIGARVPILPKRSPLQRSGRIPFLAPTSASRVPTGISETSLPIKGSAEKTLGITALKAKPAKKRTKGAVKTKRVETQKSLFRGPVFSHSDAPPSWFSAGDN